MRLAVQALSIGIALVLGMLFGMDYAEQEKEPQQQTVVPTLSQSGSNQTIQLTPTTQGKVEITVVDQPGSSQIVQVGPQEKEVHQDKQNPDLGPMKSSTLGEVTNSIGMGLRGQTRKMLEEIFN
ncbi:hypothetical protein [Risungbinella massiliensis]|uniref:hypothetical protein n=1 Tax=Risungbinella massiliensis TaxID=1329796 RepID=UPI0005CC02FA|nr:hypothetical protein [Risungbinella massiliensis]